jgi:cytochrome b561
MNEMGIRLKDRDEPVARRTTEPAAPHPFRRHAGPGKRSDTTRAVHLLLLLLIINQLVSSQYMRLPHGGAAPSWLLQLHEYAGLVTLPVLAVFWAWTLIRSGETRLSRLVPWLSMAGVRDVLVDAAAQGRRLIAGRAPDDRDGALASAVHGIGLLVMTVMAITGTIYFATAGTTARVVLDVHKLVANLAWAYLLAHAGMAILHQLLGSNMFARMFWLQSLRRARTELPRDAEPVAVTIEPQRDQGRCVWPEISPLRQSLPRPRLE